MSRLASEPLARAFAAVGLCVGILASTLDPPRELHLGGVSLAIAGVAIAGWIIGRVASRLYAVGLSVATGMLLAVTVAPYWFPFSVTLTLGAIPIAVATLGLVGRGVGRAQPLSVLDRSARRALTAVAASLVALAAWATLAAGTNEAFVALIMVAAAFTTAVLVLVTEIRMALRVRSARGGDFGFGARVVERREEVPASYRSTAVIVHTVDESRHHALRWIGRVIAVQLAAATVACCAFGFSAATACAIRATHPKAPLHMYAPSQPRSCTSARRR